MIEDLVKYYQNLLVIQYHEVPTAKAEIELAVKTFTGDDILSQILTAFDVDTAVGKQLDLIGKIVGLPRKVDGFTFHLIYYAYDGLVKPMKNPEGHGLSDIGAPVAAIFKEYENALRSIYDMTDSQYRRMIKMKILINNSVATDKAIDDSLWEVFNGGISMVDNGDMTITATVQPEYEFDGRLAEYLKLYPRPLGTSLTINYL